MAYWYALKRLALLQSALAGCLMLALLGCQQKPNDLAVFDEYLNRVEGTFDLDLQAIGEDRDALQAILRYLPPRPERRDTLLELPPITIGLLQFADLYGCELQVLIGERNSVLGKVMHTSRRLDYESRLFDALYACMAYTLDADFSTTEKLAFLSGLLELQQQKKQQLPAVIWNSSFGSVELARYLRVGAGQSDSEFESLLEGALPDLLSPDYLGLFEQWLEAIARLQSVSQWDMGGISRYVHNSTVPGVIESERLSEVSEIRFTPYIRLFQFWEVLPGLGLYFHRAGYYQARLNQVSALIEARLDRGVICPVPGKMPVRVKGLLFNYYGPTVQPYLTKLDQVYRREVSLFRKLVEQQQIVVPEDWMRYFQYYFDYAPDSGSEPHQATEMHTQSLWLEFRKAVDRHQKAWQRVLDQCRGDSQT